ncbi:hypothetical protein ES332_A11G303100v1 [Gossypium tomentosum]|uniref:Uncharacterized protein n=1 Tax=Gossypium tomentosum TaxID=34277 RepID=A0A5D2NH43_GOSTO|nr:hypothetical protein ES332_A11G303100v1 [Gossypium tomentosum]
MTSKGALPYYAPKALPGSANQSNLLPTDTVFAFQAIIPSFSNNGKCETTHKYMTLGVIDDDDLDMEKNQEEAEKMLKKYRLTAIDFIHACCSLTLFLVLACSSFNGPNGNASMTNLPLAAGILASGLIWHADKPDHGNRNEEKQTREIANKEPLPKPK